MDTYVTTAERRNAKRRSPAAELQQIAAEYPDLTEFGFGIWQGTKPNERQATFKRDRQTLLASVERFEATRNWIQRRLRPIKTLNRRCTSYGLKHVCEREIGYVTNGVFIAAMAACGYRVKRHGANAYFNVAKLKTKRKSV